MLEIFLKSLSDTKKLGLQLASELVLYNEIYLLLNGELASGKTTLAKFIIKKLNIKEEVTSPSFIIMNKYHNKAVNINHVDFYRLNNVSNENLNLYLEEFENCINIIEWPNIVKSNLKDKKIIELVLKIVNENDRLVNITINYKSDLLNNISKVWK